MKYFTALVVASVLIPASSSVYGQTVPGVLEETGQRTVERSSPVFDAEAAPLPGVSIEFATQQPPANAESLEFVLNDVALQGAQLLDPSQLRPLYADLIGRNITLLEAFGVIEAVQAAHRDAGFIFTRVVAPPQTIEDGVFRIQVVEATIGKVIIEEPEGDVGGPKPLVERMARKLEGTKNPTLGDLERTLLLINDIPGITQATAVPRPGEGAGSVDIYINVVRDPFSGVFFADNRQSPILGPGLAGVSLEASSYSAYGDTTTVSFFNAFGDEWVDDLKERNTIQIEHQRNIGTNGTIVKVRGLASQTAPGDELRPLDLDGQQFNGEILVEHPFIRTRPLSVWGYAGIGFDENTLDTGGGAVRIVEDKIRTARIGGRLLQRDDYGYTRAEGEIRQGLDIFGASETSTGARSRLDGKPDYTLVRGQVEREFFVPTTDNALSIYALALGQYSFDPLFSAEEMAIGGGQIGRAYDPSELTGDSGYGIAAELRYQISFEAQGVPIGMQFYTFGDHAEVFNKSGSGQPDAEDLTSYGGGIRVSLPDELTLGGEVAIPTHRLLRNSKNDPRFFFNLVKRF